MSDRASAPRGEGDQGAPPKPGGAVHALPIVPKNSTFERLVADDAVDLLHLVEAKVMSSETMTTDPDVRAVGDHFYPLLRSSFERRHKGVQLIVQEDVGVAVALHSGAEGDPIGDRVDTFVLRKTIRFDWTEPRVLMQRAASLGEETCRWITNDGERRALLELVFGIISQIQTTLARENRQRKPGEDESVKPTDRMGTDLDIIATQLDTADRQFDQDTQRAAQFRYAAGMAAGAVAMTVLCALLGVVFWRTGARVTGGVALAAGAVGAIVSVLQRMTKGTLELNTQAGHNMIVAFGALRPFVGGVFGVIIYFVIRADLISVFSLPPEPQKAIAYVAVFAFVAGFNERFFQDMLASASSARPDI